MVVSEGKRKKQAAKLFYRLTLVNLLDSCEVFLRKVRVFLGFGLFAHIAGSQCGYLPNMGQ